jgi:PAS domain S-box-containing protein
MHDRTRILYIDDETDLLNLGKVFLEKGGEFSIDTAASAGEARVLMTSGNYDAIVSDYQMPGEDGITFLKSVRSSCTDIPFILFTGRGREEVVIEAINNGVDFYIQKGGDARAQFAELAHKIRHAVTRHKDAARRMITEDALRESEAKFSRLFQSSPVILALIDITNNSFVDINDAFVRSTGYSREEVIGESPESLGIYIDAGTQELILAELRKGSEVSAREIPFRRKDGEIRTCLYSVLMITMGGNPIPFPVLKTSPGARQWRPSSGKTRTSWKKHWTLLIWQTGNVTDRREYSPSMTGSIPCTAQPRSGRAVTRCPSTVISRILFIRKTGAAFLKRYGKSGGTPKPIRFLSSTGSYAGTVQWGSSPCGPKETMMPKETLSRFAA